MFETERDDDSQLERQWLLLEEHFINGKPIVARILEIRNGNMFVDVEGIQGYVEQFTFGFTWSRSPEALGM